jgi:DNA repair exonuclease SbcCD ATPase subunit
MITDISQARKIYEQKLGRRSLFIEQREKAIRDWNTANSTLEKTIKARTIVQTVARATQEKIEFHISNLVTMALAAVFPEPYEFKLSFVERRNASEADLIFSKNGNEISDILAYGGGGIADVANFALIISLWALKKTRPTFITDEPLKFLHSPIYQEKASIMMKMLCDKLGIQLVIVSDQQNIIAAADKIIRIGCKDGVSFVEEEK